MFTHCCGIEDTINLRGAEFFSLVIYILVIGKCLRMQMMGFRLLLSHQIAYPNHNVMPFGLCNVPKTFVCIMDTFMQGRKWNMCSCYLDDLVVFAPDFSTHFHRLEEVLRWQLEQMLLGCAS